MIKSILLLFSFVTFIHFSASASETVKGAKKDFENFKTEMTTKLDKVEKELMLLKAKAKNKKNEVQEKTIAELEENRTQLKNDLDKLKSDGSDGWKKIKTGIADSFDKLNSKIQKVMKE